MDRVRATRWALPGLALLGWGVAGHCRSPECVRIPMPDPVSIVVSDAESFPIDCFESLAPAVLRIDEHGVSVELTADPESDWWNAPGDGLGVEWGLADAGERIFLRHTEDSGIRGRVTITAKPRSDYSQSELQAIETTVDAARLISLPETGRDAVARAAGLFARAGGHWREAGRSLLAAFSDYQQAHLLRDHDRFEAAKPLYERCMGEFNLLSDVGMEGRCANGLGLVQRELGDLDGALESFEVAEVLARSARDDYVSAAAINNQCLILFHRDRLEEAESCFERAVDAYVAAGQSIRSAAPRFNLGAVRTSMLKLAEAETALLGALDLIDEGVIPSREGQVLINLAALQRRVGRFAAAERSLMRARQLFDSLDRPLWLARSLRELGYLYRGLGDTSQAVTYFREALAIDEENPKNRGLLLLALSELVPQQAEELRAQAAAIFATPGSEQPYLIARVLMAEAEAHLADGRLAEAESSLVAFERASAAAENPVLAAHQRRLAGALALKRDQPRQAVDALSGARSFFLGNGLLSSALQTATLEAQALVADGRYGESLAVSDEALNLARIARSAVTSPRVRVTFDALYRQLVTGWLQARHAQYLAADNPGAIFEEAVEVALGHYNRALREGIGAGRREAADPEREELIRQLSFLFSWETEVPDIRDRDRLTALLNRLHETSARGRVSGGVANIGARTLRATLTQQDALLLLHWGVTPQLFVIEKDGKKRQWLQIDGGEGQLEADAQALIAALSRGPGSIGEARIGRVGAALLAGLDAGLDGVDRLLIIADGPGALLPWGMLEYRGQVLADRLVPVRIQSPGRKPEVATDSVLRRSLVINGFNRPIEEEIEPLLAGSGDVTVLAGPDASRNRLLETDMANFSHIHVAAHGQSFSDTRMPAMLRLPGSGGRDQSLLDAETIEGWTLNAGLVVLAACESAAGEVYSGEQPLGLERAFIAAGARNVISTLWRVEDRASQFFSRELYRALAERHDIEQAYRRALDALRAERRWRHPHYWAPFTLSASSLPGE